MTYPYDIRLNLIVRKLNEYYRVRSEGIHRTLEVSEERTFGEQLSRFIALFRTVPQDKVKPSD